nr:DNA gyrase C-terminal beta-propeller domain-containing protein [Piscinibacter sp.]
VKVIDEPVTVVVSLKGWVRALKGHEIDAATLAFKAGDGLYGSFPCRSVDSLIVFGSNGRVYSTAVAGLPGGRGDGQPITTLIELETGTQPSHYFAGSATQTLLLAGTGGFGLLARVGDLVARQKGGKSFLSLEADEKPLPPTPADGATQVACLSLAGRLLSFGIDELKLQPNGGRGLTLMDLDAKDALVSVAAFTQSLQVLGIALRGGKPRDETLKGAALNAYAGKRARKGKAVEGMKAQRVVPAG